VEANALQDLTVAREAYRTALESHQPTRQLKVAYGRTQASYRDAERELQAARSDEASTAGPARAAEQRIEHAVASAGKTQEARRRRHDRIVFGLRLLFALLALAGSYAWLGRMRKRRSRYLVVGFALVGASAVLALIMAVDYITDYIDVTATGPVVLSLAGIALTLVALWSLQRYLAQRVPIRRVRKRECPFCGYPVGENSHCEGCGREVIARCSTCESPRRVGTAHCGACGAA
jgi:hypothetical protein